MQKIFLVLLWLTFKRQKLSKLQVYTELLNHTHMQVLGRSHTLNKQAET